MGGKKKPEGAGGLGTYRDKRDPLATPEPFGGRAPAKDGTRAGRFVVHQHAATRMHYDLRIEIGGALMSFAVPRGPSLHPDDKRLAVHTEDHPIGYLDFEGVIPAGQYGAGAMIAWDQGSVRYLESTAEEGIARAKIDFALFGHKLRGRFGLIHTGARAKDPSEKNHWLLVKKRDGHEREEGSILDAEPRSVLSGLTVEERGRAGAIAAEVEARAAAWKAPTGEVAIAGLTPMLCLAHDGPPEPALARAKHLFELKLDGVRLTARRDGDDVELRYRSGRSAGDAFPELARALRTMAARRFVLDGELCAFDDDGRPSFERIARRLHLRRPRDVARAALEIPAVYMAFDLLAVGDRDLRRLPLHRRKALLAALVQGKGRVRALDALENAGAALWRFCDQQDLEGVVVKRADSPYEPGPRRSGAWTKVKRRRRDAFVVVGLTKGRGSRKLGALVVATRLGDTWRGRGKVGSGIDGASEDALLEMLTPHGREGPPAGFEGERPRGARWVEPVVVVDVDYAELSESGSLRHPVFAGVSAASVASLAATEAELAAEADRDDDDEGAAARITRATLTNQTKVFWPGEGYTKGDLCDYYAAIADVLLPHLVDRPLVLVRYPDGIEGKSFFQWNVPRGTPSWVRTVQIREEGKRPGKGAKHAFVVDDVDGLVHLANLGCIPLHVLPGRRGRVERCDFLTIDFDLGGRPFAHAITLARTLRELCQAAGLPAFPKTSGQTGLHVLVALGAGGVPNAVATQLCELLGRLVVERHGDIATMERRVDKRGPKVYVDTGQTGRGRTIVAPYSVRAFPGARVSTPLWWDEVSLALDPAAHTMLSVPDRVDELGDPLAGWLDLEVDLHAALAGLASFTRPP